MRLFPGTVGSQGDNESKQRVGPVNGSGAKTASRLRSILASCGLTLRQVSLESERLYGQKSSFRIPHTLYHSFVNSPSFSLSLPQTCALSRISGYRFEDWLEALGIDVRLLAGLEAGLPFRRTRLIDPALSGKDFVDSGMEEQGWTHSAKVVVPLGQVLQEAPGTFSSARHKEERQPLFARIGSEDAISFPELLPGSIVRLNPDAAIPGAIEFADRSRASLLMVEYGGGLRCGRFRLSNDGLLHTITSELAYAPVMLRYPREARILDRVDMEIRWMHRLHAPRVPTELATDQNPGIVDEGPPGPGTLIRQARRKAGLTLEEASRLSRRVAIAAGDQRYAMAQSTLSDYEVQNAPPRHLEKAVAVCLIYGILLIDFVRASGTAAESLGQQRIPEELRTEGTRASSRGSHLYSSERNESPASLMQQFGAIPSFLAGCLAEISGIARPSLRDFFWLGGDHPFLPAHTEGSMAALVDRRKKRPVRLPGLPGWMQPAYVLLLRDGGYRCACCCLNDQTLLLCPGPKSGLAPEALRLGRDAEVIGQIVALARHIA